MHILLKWLKKLQTISSIKKANHDFGDGYIFPLNLPIKKKLELCRHAMPFNNILSDKYQEIIKSIGKNIENTSYYWLPLNYKEILEKEITNTNPILFKNMDQFKREKTILSCLSFMSNSENLLNNFKLIN